MTFGTFDDRDDARIAAKLWLQSHEPAEYTVANMRALLTSMVRQYSDPVDDIRVEWRERCYGILRGVVEFAAEQLAQLRADAGPVRIMLEKVAQLLKEAVSLLPKAVSGAHAALCGALDLLEASLPAVAGNERVVEKSRGAAALAVSLLTNRGSRLSAAAV